MTVMMVTLGIITPPISILSMAFFIKPYCGMAWTPVVISPLS